MPEFSVQTEAIGTAASGVDQVASALQNIRAGDAVAAAGASCPGSQTAAACAEIGPEITNAIRASAEQVVGFGTSLRTVEGNYNATESGAQAALGG